MLYDLQGKTVLLTGASRGIGLALAKALSEAGCRIVAVSTQASQAPGLKDLEGLVAAIDCDLSDPGSMKNLADQARTLAGPIDILIHNTGVQHDLGFADGAYRTDMIIHEMAVNLVAPIALTRALLADLQRGGRVVFLSSVLAHAAKGRAAPYSAAKSGLSMFAHALAAECGGRLTVMDVVPPVVATGMTAGRSGPKIRPEAVAAATLAGLRTGRRRVVIGQARLAMVLARLSPRLLGKILSSR